MKNPMDHKTGERIKTPRDTFSVVTLTVEEMKEAGYSLHFPTTDGRYLIMANGTLAFAVPTDK